MTPPTPARQTVLDAVADAIESLALDHPVRVAIDGPDAAGKTTLAHELAATLETRGRTVIRASIDDFARPSSDRYRQGRDSADGYFAAGFDNEALVARLLAPLGPGGDRWHITRTHDLAVDAPYADPPRTAPEDAVLIVDGVFLGRPELAGHWDLRVFVHVTADESLRRALARDVPRLGSAAAVEARYRARYLPAQAAYLVTCRPVGTADAVIDNEDPQRPTIRARGDAG